MNTSSGSRDKLDAGRASGALRADRQRPDGADGMQTERRGRSAAPEVGNAVDVDCDHAGAAARRVDRDYLRGAERAQEVGPY